MKITFNKNKICYLLVIALILSMGYAAKPRKERPQMKVIPDRFIVTHKTTGVLSTLTSAIGALDGKLDFNIDGPGISVYNSKNPNFAARARKIAGVVSVIPDFEMQWVDDDWSSDLKASATANDPPFAYNQNSYFNMQWGLDAINAIEAWQTGARGRGTLVAVLDTGFDLDHPDLQNNINTQKSRNFVPGETLQWGRRDSSFSHGTHVAAIIAGVDNNVGVIGVAPDAKLMLVKVLSDSGSGQFSWILQGIRHAVDQGADIINLSLGGFVDRVTAASYIDLFAQSMTYAYNRGVTVIAAAGNDAYDLDDQNNQGKINLPSQSPYVISVSSTTPIGWAKAPATTNLDNFATSYSNYGSTVTFSAPGGDDLYPNTATDTATIAGITKPAYVFDLVFSAINNGWGWASGTSMAAPHVSGVAALIVRRNNRRLTPDQVKAKLQASADDLGYPGQDVYYGLGRVNAYRAVTI